MKLLLLGKEEPTNAKVTFAIESRLGIDTVQVTDVASCLKGLGTPNESIFNLLVVNVQDFNADELASLGKSSEHIPSMVICSSDSAPTGWQHATLIKATTDSALDGLITAIEAAAREGTIPPLLQERTEFCRIRTLLLLELWPLKADVYIRLNETKFIKLFREGDPFEKSDWEKYTVKKGVEFLFVRKDQSGLLVEKFIQDLKKSPSLETAVDVFELVQEMGSQIGFTRDVQLLANEQVSLAVKEMSRNPRLKEMLRQIRDSPGTYVAKHSSLTGYLCCAIAAHLEWGSESTFMKLSMAAFLHDISIEDDKLCRCETEEEATAMGYGGDDLQGFMRHPHLASEIAQSFDDIPSDVDTILSQHHENPSGEGFPRGLKAQHIFPLSGIFIVAHRLGDYLLKNNMKYDQQGFQTTLEPEFFSGKFRKILDGLDSLRLIDDYPGDNAPSS